MNLLIWKLDGVVIMVDVVLVVVVEVSEVLSAVEEISTL